MVVMIVNWQLVQQNYAELDILFTWYIGDMDNGVMYNLIDDTSTLYLQYNIIQNWLL